MDPLKPVNNLARFLWRKTEQRSESTDSKPASQSTNAINEPPAAQPSRSLREQLKRRLALLPPGDAKAAREVFVETTLLSQLGDNLGNDPSLSEMKQNIAKQLTMDAVLCARLDALLDSVRNGNDNA